MGSRTSSGKGLSIIALILGASGLILGIFSFIQIPTGYTGTVIVGHWESLYRDMSNPDFNLNYNWLIEVDDMHISDSNYLTLDQTAQHQNTRFHLTKGGWYRVDLIMLWFSLATGMIYGLKVYENGINILYVEYFRNADTNQAINTKFYIFNNGSDYYEFNCNAVGIDDFDISPIQLYNQLIITYIGE
jgi:hypothetical protein